MEFFNSRSVKILCVILSLVIIFSIMGANGLNIFSPCFEYITSGISKVSASAVKGMEKKSYKELEAENKKLKKENADLKQQLVDYYQVKDENARLWKYYDIKKNHEDYDILPATVIRRDSNDEFYSFTADVGSKQGVQEQDPVITEKGLVGFVSSVSNSSCHITTILSPDIQAGAIDVKTKENGIISGNPLYSDKNLTTLTKINASSNMVKGDIIITTGIGGVYPSDIIVGEIKSIKFDPYDATKFALVKPYENIKEVTDVIILTDFGGKGEISAEGNNE